MITMAHGSGGKKTSELIESLLLPVLSNEELNRQNDGACIDVEGSRMVFSTDSFVIKPLFFYFSIISKGAIAENAVLEIEKLSLKVKCSGCGSVSCIDIRKFRCPSCSGQDLKILQRKEFYIESFEVEQLGD